MSPQSVPEPISHLCPTKPWQSRPIFTVYDEPGGQTGHRRARQEKKTLVPTKLLIHTETTDTQNIFSTSNSRVVGALSTRQMPMFRWILLRVSEQMWCCCVYRFFFAKHNEYEEARPRVGHRFERWRNGGCRRSESEEENVWQG
jgi:hypothetical protein